MRISVPRILRGEARKCCGCAPTRNCRASCIRASSPRTERNTPESRKHWRLSSRQPPSATPDLPRALMPTRHSNPRSRRLSNQSQQPQKQKSPRPNRRLEKHGHCPEKQAAKEEKRRRQSDKSQTQSGAAGSNICIRAGQSTGNLSSTAWRFSLHAESAESVMRDTWRLGLGAIIHLEICVLCVSAFQKTTAAKTSGSIAADCCPHCGMRTAKTQHTHEALAFSP